MGTSERADAYAAGLAAARTALDGLDGRKPDLVIMYASVRYDLAAALAAVNEATGGASLIGATTSGQLQNGELTAPGEGLSVLALAGGGYSFGVGWARGARTDPVTAGATLARRALASMDGQRRPYEALLVLSDGLAGDPQELLTGVHRVTGYAVPVVGGAAGDDRRLAETSVFFGDQVLTDAAVAVWIGSDQPLTVACGHGWHPSGLPLLVTSVDGPVVREIGGRPALTVYEENFRHEDPADEISTDRDGGYHSAHAFGLVQPDGNLLIRGAFVDDRGELRTFAPLPLYSAVQVVSCQVDDLLTVGMETIASAVERGDAGVVLVFDCVARLDILADRGDEEAARLQRAAGAVPTFGFYTYGEFARTTSVAGYHNATIAAMAL